MRADVLSLLKGDATADRAVPPSGLTARITVFAAAVMAFLAVFVLAVSFSMGRVAGAWEQELARTATLRIVAPAAEAPDRLQAALAVLETTPGIASARVLSAAEQQDLLSPWFGPDLPLDTLALPQLIDIVADDAGYDRDTLLAQLQAEVPGAVLDDHARWRAPLIAAAARLQWVGTLAVVLIAMVMAAVITLAAQASLAANRPIIQVLRLIGATDVYIARAFVRRFTLRGLLGAVCGTTAGVIAVALLSDQDVPDVFLSGIGFRGLQWAAILLIPVFAAGAAFWATRVAALRLVKEIS